MLEFLILVTIYFHPLFKTFFAFTLTGEFLKEEKLHAVLNEFDCYMT